MSFDGESFVVSRIKWIALLLAAGAIAGCGGRSGTAQVSGRVLMKDGSAPSGGVCVVQLIPSADTAATIRKGASGEIQKDGHFDAYTRREGDGVFYGKYDVTFSVWKSSTEPVSLIDNKYTKASTTPYHIVVDGNKTDLKFELDAAPAKKK